MKGSLKMKKNIAIMVKQFWENQFFGLLALYSLVFLSLTILIYLICRINDQEYPLKIDFIVVFMIIIPVILFCLATTLLILYSLAKKIKKCGKKGD